MSPQMIETRAALAQIMEHVKLAAARGLSAEDAIKVQAQTLLAPAVVNAEAAEAKWKLAEENAMPVREALVIKERECHILVCSIRDDLNTLVGRSAGDPHLALAFPGGVDTYTSGDARKKAVLLTVLQEQIRMCQASRLTDEQRTAWNAALEQMRLDLIELVAKYEPLEAALTVTEATRRTTVHLARAQLLRFKRVLENLGYTKARIFEIIPDATPTKPKTPKVPGSDGGGAPPTTKAV